MSEMEEKLNNILANPEMMQQIMSMAQSMGGSSAPPPPPESLPPIDLGLLQKLGGMAQSTAVDKNQQNLLHALGPYLSGDRIGRLERAMRAAKMAKLATGFLSQQGLKL